MAPQPFFPTGGNARSSARERGAYEKKARRSGLFCKTLTLAELLAPTCLAEADLLAFDFAGIAGHDA
jgi:hypothetical protein